MKDYPNFRIESTEDKDSLLYYILKERRNDVNDFNNLKNIFMSGRKTGKIPTSSADVTNADRIGDFNYDYTSGYLYLLVDNAGTGVWSRIALDTSW
jgi:hypothetical protein